MTITSTIQTSFTLVSPNFLTTEFLVSSLYCSRKTFSLDSSLEYRQKMIDTLELSKRIILLEIEGTNKVRWTNRGTLLTVNQSN